MIIIIGIWAGLPFFVSLHSFSVDVKLSQVYPLIFSMENGILSMLPEIQKKTETLNGAYFIFKDKVLTTNYMGSELQTPFDLNKKKIIQLQPERIEFEAKIEKNNTLTLQATIKGTLFSFTMVKE